MPAVPASEFVIFKPPLPEILPVSVTLKPLAPLLVISRSPFSLATVPDTFSSVPSFTNVAFPLFEKEPPTFKAPALLRTLALPILVTVPLMFMPAVPVSEFVIFKPPLPEILPVSVTLKPSAPLLVISRSPFSFDTVPDTFSSVPLFTNIASPLFVNVPPTVKRPLWFVTVAFPVLLAEPVMFKPPTP